MSSPTVPSGAGVDCMAVSGRFGRAEGEGGWRCDVFERERFSWGRC